MSSDAGTAVQPRARTVIAVLTVIGFALIAAVLPAVGGNAPGSSLLPTNTTAGNGSAADQGAEGQAGVGDPGASGGSLVGGLLGRLPSRGGLVTPGPGDGRSAFGALDPGSRTGVGSSQGLVSQSLRNQSSRPHFVVQSSEPGYWRTGAYGTYTGDGWDRNPRDRQEALPLSPTTESDRRRVVQRYRLLRSARSLPTAWQPVAVEGVPAEDLRVSPNRAVQSRRGLPANTTYTAVSSAPPRDVERLRTAGTDYPEPVAFRFVTLPESVPDRVTERTDRITADADTPYETAVAIEQWLEANKEYSLRASHQGGDVADQFIFEMDRGYCEYFATSMVVMLRTQDIPARYVVGYSTGQPQGNDTYLVRAMNAHAWVEVYFPETGWVRFDPTPGRSRLSREYQALEQNIENRDPEEVAEQLLADAANPTTGGGPPPNGAGGRLAPAPTPAASNASLNTGADTNGTRALPEPGNGTGVGNGTGSDNRTGTPSAADLVEGNESLDEETVSDLLEAYNHTESGSPGETFDASSETSYRVSLSPDPVPGREVTVTVERGTDPVVGVGVSVNGEQVGVTNESGMVRATVPFERSLEVNVTARGAGSPALAVGVSPTARAPPNGTSRTFDVPTDVAVAVNGTVAPGGTATVTATIDGVPVPDATVALDGETVGPTDEAGRREVQLPVEQAVNVTVSRGAASGARAVELADVAVTTAGFALPGLSVTALVTDDGDPVEGATVSAGATTATTGPDGRASLSLPVGLGAQVTAETPAGVTARTSVRYRYLTTVGAVLLTVAALGSLVLLLRRARAADRSVRAELVRSLRWLSGAVVGALVALSVHGERVVAALPVVAARLRDALRQAVLAVGERDPALLDPRPLLTRLRARLLALVAGVQESLTTAPAEPAAADRDDDGTVAAAASDSDPRALVRRAWREFRAQVPVGDHRTKTPGELARRAVEAGFPRSSVRTLRDAVRDVEYGHRDPDEVVGDVTEARESLDPDDEDDQPVPDGRGGRR